MMEADYTIRRADGLYENEVSSKFHLATLMDAPVPPRVSDQIVAEHRQIIAERIMRLIEMKDGADRQYEMGFVSGLEAALKEVFRNVSLPGFDRPRRVHVEGGPILSKPNWHRDWANSERRDRLNEPQENPKGPASGKGRNRKR